jgi:hypothetical protein
LKSTGPRSRPGKQLSRRNALRHGFTAETVLEPLEDVEEFRTFEAAILGEYLPQTPVEQELVRRLASLFWRLRRATSIETGLLRIQAEILLAFRSSRQTKLQTQGDPGSPQEFQGNGIHETGSEDGRPSRSRDLALGVYWCFLNPRSWRCVSQRSSAH